MPRNDIALHGCIEPVQVARKPMRDCWHYRWHLLPPEKCFSLYLRGSWSLLDGLYARYRKTNGATVTYINQFWVGFFSSYSFREAHLWKYLPRRGIALGEISASSSLGCLPCACDSLREQLQHSMVQRIRAFLQRKTEKWEKYGERVMSVQSLWFNLSRMLWYGL